MSLRVCPEDFARSRMNVLFSFALSSSALSKPLATCGYRALEMGLVRTDMRSKSRIHTRFQRLSTEKEGERLHS